MEKEGEKENTRKRTRRERDHLGIGNTMIDYDKLKGICSPYWEANNTMKNNSRGDYSNHKNKMIIVPI